MKIQLDRDAMFALFPEGSEAQVELRRAVMDAWVKQHVKSIDLTPEIKAAINSEVNKMGVQVTKDLGTFVRNKPEDFFDRSGRFDLNSDVRAAIEQGVVNSMFKLIRDQVEKYSQTLITYEVNRCTQRFIEEEIAKRLKEKFEELMRKK